MQFQHLEGRYVLTFAFTHQVIDLPVDESHSAVAMEVVDLNGDAHLDLIVSTVSSRFYSGLPFVSPGLRQFFAAEVGTNVHAFLGTDSGFQGVALEQISDLVLGMSKVDLNGDGREDFVVLTDRGFVTLVDSGVTDQAWQGLEVADTVTESEIWDIKPADLNGDRFGDMVVGVGNELRTLLGKGDGTFVTGSTISLTEYRPTDSESTSPNSDGPSSFDVGDLNSDGLDDLVVSVATVTGFTLGGPMTDGVVVALVNDATGAFAANVYEERDGSIFLFDMNRDDHLDVLVGGNRGDYIESEVLHGNGDGSFVAEGSCCVRGSYRVEAADGSRLYTSIATSFGGPPFLFFENERVGVDLAPWNGGGSYLQFAIPEYVDVDSDGVDEIVGLDEKSISVLRPTDPSPLVAAEPIKLPAGERSGKFIDDFDNDGYVDIVVVESTHDSSSRLPLRIRWGGPDGPSESAELIDLDLGEVETTGYTVQGRVTDVNADGTPDIRLRVRDGAINLVSSSDREIRFGGFDTEYGDVSFGQPGWGVRSSVSAQGDIDGDGFAEQVTLHDTWTDGLLTIQRGVSVNEFEPLGITQSFPKPLDGDTIQYNKSIQLWDITSDGVLDIVYSDFATKDVLVFSGISDIVGGDVNRDDEVNIEDLDLLSTAIAAINQPNASLKLDWNGDRQANEADVTHWVREIALTELGDINLDQRVDFADFLKLSQNFGKEDATWSDGDFNGDSVVSFEDFLILQFNFGFRAERL